MRLRSFPRRVGSWLLAWAGELILTLICLVALAIQWFEIVTGSGSYASGAPGTSTHPIAHAARLLAVLIVAVAVWRRRRHPFRMAVLGLAATVGYALLTPTLDGTAAAAASPDAGYGIQLGPGGNGVPMAVLLGLMYSGVVFSPWRRSRLLVVAAVAATAIPAVAGIPLSREPDWVGHLSAPFGPLIIAGLALLVRQRRSIISRLAEQAAELDRRRSADARAAVAEERIQIARELHDVVAHHVTVMTVAITAADTVLATDLGQARDAIAAARGSGHAALDEMRSLVGALRAAPEREPTRGLDLVPAMLATMAAAGLVVRVRVSGEARQLPTAVDLAAFRVVQEALTNTLRHSGAVVADLEMSWRTESLTVRVSDRGVGRQDGADRATAGGQGLPGMAERVAAFGGELTAHNRAGGGFEVRATLPYTGRPVGPVARLETPSPAG